MTTFAQIYATVDDIIADAQSPGLDIARVYSALREASDFIQKKIGWFIPVTQTLKTKAPEDALDLFVPPLLAVTELIDYDVTLTSNDYILKPDGGFWPNGPYGKIVVDPESTSLFTWCEIENGIEITGRWGMYERSGATGATVQNTTQQSASDAVLIVEDGSKVSPGMVLLIGSEQELATGWSTPSSSVTTASASIAAADNVLTLADATKVKAGEVIRIDFEQMRVKDTRSSTGQVSVVRGWNGTGVTTHTASSAVDVYRTVTVERGVNGTTAATHTNGTSILRYYAPDDIAVLTREIAVLILNKAKSGYQGRTGNDQTGVVFYNDLFPRYDLAQISANYYIPRVP